jgi:hypothetical protein
MLCGSVATRCPLNNLKDFCGELGGGGDKMARTVVNHQLQASMVEQRGNQYPHQFHHTSAPKHTGGTVQEIFSLICVSVYIVVQEAVDRRKFGADDTIGGSILERLTSIDACALSTSQVN